MLIIASIVVVIIVGFGLVGAFLRREQRRELALNLRLKAEKAKTVADLHQVWNEMAERFGNLTSREAEGIREYIQGRLDSM